MDTGSDCDFHIGHRNTPYGKTVCDCPWDINPGFIPIAAECTGIHRHLPYPIGQFQTFFCVQAYRIHEGDEHDKAQKKEWQRNGTLDSQGGRI
jgi:hypothetical protein